VQWVGLETAQDASAAARHHQLTWQLTWQQVPLSICLMLACLHVVLNTLLSVC